jgi:hypothetical protein
MRLCLPARMGGGGKVESLPWSGPAGKARHTGATILLWEREGKALGVPTNQETGPVRLPQPQRGSSNGTLARRDADGQCGGKRSGSKAVVPKGQRRQFPRKCARRPSGKERSESASGSAKRPRTLKERSGKECDLRKSRSLSHAPDRHPKGQDYGLVRAEHRAGCPQGSANANGQFSPNITEYNDFAPLCWHRGLA